ncbi:hypothetical protein SCUCBS95973_009692 [Sporothrix curviconia]|uniref:Uncharacterized protein n=1 Tax=Sporothrix curviconia TaxID=1260050 RepID=A0ABP0CYQ1_9PEZI
MASPAKRRVLAPLDANTSVAAALPMSLAGKPAASENSSKLPLSPPSSAIAKKRTLPETSLDEEPADSTTPLKKPCLSGNNSSSSTLSTMQPQASAPAPAPSVVAAAATAAPRPSLSPATSSVFDLSAMVDTTQATNITEPDIEAPRAVANASGTLTREQSRQRAEILKLRLGLARYKVRTGQVDVPLEHLRIVPSASTSQQQQQQPRTLLPISREWSAGEWVRQQQEQSQAGAAAQPRQQPPLPQRWALWGPASSSAGGAPGSRGRDQSGVSATSSSSDEEDEEDEDDGDALDSRPLPQQPRHQLDTVDVIEDSDVSDRDAPRRQSGGGGDDSNDDNEDEDEGDEEDEDGDLPQLPQIRRLSPTKKSSGAKRNPLTTPRGNRLLVDDSTGGHLDRLTSSAMRGSAVNGLLSLARS